MLDGVQVSVAVGGCEAEDSAGNVPPDASIAGRVRRVGRGGDSEPVAFLREQAALHDLVWVVAPESGGVLSSLRAAVPDRQWLGCSQGAIDLTSSKRATAHHLSKAGIACTRPIDSSAVAGAACGARRWVVKPDDGCGSSGARRYDDYAAAWSDRARRRLRQEDAVMEPWIEGDPLSMALLCGAGPVEVLAVNRQRISVDGSGSLAFDGVAVGAITGPRARAMAVLARRVSAAVPGLSGFVGVDVTWHPGSGPVVIEINPRVTCAYEGLSAKLRGNVAQRLLARHRRGHGPA